MQSYDTEVCTKSETMTKVKDPGEIPREKLERRGKASYFIKHRRALKVSSKEGILN